MELTTRTKIERTDSVSDCHKRAPGPVVFLGQDLQRVGQSITDGSVRYSATSVDVNGRGEITHIALERERRDWDRLAFEEEKGISRADLASLPIAKMIQGFLNRVFGDIEGGHSRVHAKDGPLEIEALERLNKALARTEVDREIGDIVEKFRHARIPRLEFSRDKQGITISPVINPVDIADVAQKMTPALAALRRNRTSPPAE